jgi:hypothetical protein
MLKLGKNPSLNVAELAPAWHPDFRNPERLPDTKVIRTSFVVNGAAVLVATVLIVWFCSEIYQLRELNRQSSEWQKQIDRDKVPSDRAIAQYKQFQAEIAKLSQVDAFVKSRPLVSELLLQLGKTLPEYMAIDRFDLGSTALIIHGSVRGAPDQASGRASTYLQVLKSDKWFSDVFADISLVNLSRNGQTGSVGVDITLKLKEPKKP